MNGASKRFSDESDDRFFVERAAGFAAFVIPAALGVLAASPEPYWLDSPELTAAAQTLGIPHPPGHPLYVMLAKIFTLLPFGGIAFRVSVASSVFGAVATFLLYRICFRLVQFSTRGLPIWMIAAVSLAASLTAAVVPAWWFQCVRQEIYSLQLMLFLAAIFPVLHFCLNENTASENSLYLSAFFVGLGFADQPVMTATVLPAYIPILVRLSRRAGGIAVLRKTAGLFGIALFAMTPYALLPLRAASGAPVSLGGVHSVSDFVFVVTAKAYQRTIAAQYAAGFGTPTMDTLLHTLRGIGGPLIVGFLLGVSLLLRAPRTRLIGVFIALLAAVPTVLRTVTVFDPFPADYQGYMTGVVAVCGLGYAVFAGVTIQTFLLRVRSGVKVSIAFLGALVLLTIWKARSARLEVDLSSFDTSRVFSDFCFEDTVPGTLVLPSDFNLFYALSSGFYIDGSTPEATVVNPTMFSYPGYLNQTLSLHPTLAPLARSMLVHGTLVESALAEAALSGPLRVEPSRAMDDAAIRYLLPDGPLYRAAPQPSAESDAEAASLDNDERLETLHRLVGVGWQEPETRSMLFNMHLKDAVFSARRGDGDGAKRALKAALALEPDVPLEAALEQAEGSAREDFDAARFLDTIKSPLP